MVKLEEVVDEEFLRAQDGPIADDDDWDTDSGMRPPNLADILAFFYDLDRALTLAFRLRRLLHCVNDARRDLLRAGLSTSRYYTCLNPKVLQLENQHCILMGKIGTQVGRQDAVGCKHERAAIGRTVGTCI